MTEKIESAAVRLVESATWKVLQGVAFPLGVILLAWMMTMMLSTEHRVTVIESSRFTHANGVALERRFSDHESVLAHPGMDQRATTIEDTQVEINRKLDDIYQLLLERQR